MQYGQFVFYIVTALSSTVGFIVAMVLSAVFHVNLLGMIFGAEEFTAGGVLLVVLLFIIIILSDVLFCHLLSRGGNNDD